MMNNIGIAEEKNESGYQRYQTEGKISDDCGSRVELSSQGGKKMAGCLLGIIEKSH